ncbi:MAG: effector-binding domain-containing protein [Porticoccus sp.]|jgi:effector-binding domain-containing protein
MFIQFSYRYKIKIHPTYSAVYFLTDIKRVGSAILVAVLSAGNAMAIEEAEYLVVLKEQSFEVRRYEMRVLAETIVDGDFESAGSKAFSPLFKYISGNNKSRRNIEMTATVNQETLSEKIDMTAPVGQQRKDGRWAVSFMMPSSYSMETLPVPTDPNVTLRQVPVRYIAATRYSGFWSEENYHRNLDQLYSWMEKQHLSMVGDPIWARYNPPFMPWFLRRNEILVPVEWHEIKAQKK